MKSVVILIFILLVSCTPKATTKNNAYFREQIQKVEEDFKNTSQTKGIAEAFYTFADSNAVIKRENDTLIKGRENIKKYYSNPKFDNASVTWKPNLIEVSEDGTLAYTYGEYIWTVVDSLGTKKDFKGIFHTVWKRQKDRTWKYVWD